VVVATRCSKKSGEAGLVPREQQQPAKTLNASFPLGKDRSPGAVLGLSIITLGIYYLVWYFKINSEIRRHDPDIKVSPILAVLAAMIPIMNIVSAYGTAARIRQMQLDDGAHDTISPVVALLLFLFLGIGFPLYIASHLREHWHGHRRAARSS
jgi:drug/metabolite transporter (DMT)-like permease